MSGAKYQRKIKTTPDGMSDVYDVLEAFGVSCPARAHAIKKLLCAGQRGKGDVLQDLHEANQAITRASQLEIARMRVNQQEEARPEQAEVQAQPEPQNGAGSGSSAFQQMRETMWTVRPVKEDGKITGYSIIAPGGAEFLRYTEMYGSPDLHICGIAARRTSLLLNKKLQAGEMQVGKCPGKPEEIMDMAKAAAVLFNEFVVGKAE